MTSLYTTCRDVDRVVPQDIFAVMLLALPLSAVFTVTSIGMMCGV